MRMTLHHCMKDPRRRFMFGYTIDCDLMDLWYVDQAGSFMALAFDWIADVSVPYR